MPNIFDEIDKEIQTGKYNLTINKDGSLYPKCNQFTDDAVKKFGVSLPRYSSMLKYYTRYGTGKDVANRPMLAPALEDYYSGRSKIQGSGVTPVDSDTATQLANLGELVLVVGQGHATIAAPNDKPWPLIFRSDLYGRNGDKRTRVGIKAEKFKYYRIEPETYENFNKKIKEIGLSDQALFEIDETGSTDSYTELVKKLSGS